MPIFTKVLTQEDIGIWRKLRLNSPMGCDFLDWNRGRRLHPFNRVAYCDEGNINEFDYQDACTMIRLSRLQALPPKAKLVALRLQATR